MATRWMSGHWFGGENALNVTTETHTEFFRCWINLMALATMNVKIVEHCGKMRNWISFNRPSFKAVIIGLLNIVEGVLTVVSLGIIFTSFTLNFLSWNIRRQFEEDGD